MSRAIGSPSQVLRFAVRAYWEKVLKESLAGACAGVCSNDMRQI